jgi:hypothetical protein
MKYKRLDRGEEEDEDVSFALILQAKPTKE